MPDGRRETPWMDSIRKHQRAFRPWRQAVQGIVDRYRLEEQIGTRSSIADDEYREGETYNILWSVTQTMKPVVFSKTPKVVAERRHKDKDPIGRIASEVIERAADYQMEAAMFADAMNAVVLDTLLCARGVPWVRFEADREGESDENASYNNERLAVDYVHWRDFAHSLDPGWADVARDGWVARRVSMDRDSGERRFGREFMRIPMSDRDRDDGTDDGDGSERAVGDDRNSVNVWEVWDKASRRRLFVADGLDKPLEERDDPYGLQGFFPCPMPAYGTLTNEDLIPTPDYLQYSKLAMELDSISTRIRMLTEALKASGFYDASIEGIGRLLEARDGELIGVSGLANVQAKGDLRNAIQWMPVADIAGALQQLYVAREQVKEVLYDVSGISDIVRGQVDPREKASQTNLKAQYSQSRIDQRRRSVERCARDTIRILVEAMVELFPEDRLRQQSGFDHLPEIISLRDRHRQAIEQHRQAAAAFQQSQLLGGPPAPEAGAPPENGAPPPPQDPGPPPQDPVPQVWQRIVRLLKNDKMRDFRIDVESDSTIEMDNEGQAEARNTFLETAGVFLDRTVNVIQAAPAMARPLVELLLFAVRGHRVGRTLEQTFADAGDDLEQMVAQQAQGGQQADPEAEARAAKMQADTQAAQQKAQAEQAKAQADMAATQQRAAVDQRKAEIEVAQAEQKMAHEQRMGDLELQRETQRMEIEAQKAATAQEAAAVRAAQPPAPGGER